jgi:peroxiredoxin
MHALLLLALLQAPSPAAQPVRSGCSPDDPQVDSAGPSDLVQVETALAGGEQTCYRVVLTKPGQPPATGYVLGEALPAVAVFVHRREKASEESAKAEAMRARLAILPKPAGDSIKSNDPLVSTQFEDFSGRDEMGKPVSLSGLKSRVTVVTFWSPSSGGSLLQLTHLKPLYSQLHRSGLAAIGVSMDPDANHINDALDDITLGWPQMPDKSGLAARYHVDPRAGKTFVLDANHRIVAAGPMGPDIIKAVHQLLDTPPPATTAQNSGN